MAFNLGKMAGNAILNGLSGNLNEVSPQALQSEYGAYLMDGETIQTGFKLVRDAVVITDKRILDFGRQGATGSKQRVKSIRLSSIIEVEDSRVRAGRQRTEYHVHCIAVL